VCARGKGGGRSKLLWVTPRASAVGAAGEASRGITLGWSGVGCGARCGASLRGRRLQGNARIQSAVASNILLVQVGTLSFSHPSFALFSLFSFFQTLRQTEPPSSGTDK